MNSAANRRQDAIRSDPLWRATDWTPRQRAWGISAVLLITFAFVILSGSFIIGGADSRVLETVVPLGATILCLGAGLLTSVYWYPYVYAHGSVGGSRDKAGLLACGLLALTGIAALGTLAEQIIGMTFGARVGWVGQRNYVLFLFVTVLILCALMHACLAVMQSTLSWRPTREFAAPGSALGARFALRWVVMLLARNGWALIGLPLWVFVSIENQVGGSAQVQMSTHALAFGLMFGLVAAFFLLAALSELTHRG